MFILCYPFLEAWGTAVSQANAPRSHIPERFLLQLWRVWFVLSQLFWVQKRSLKDHYLTYTIFIPKEWKKRWFVRVAGARQCNKVSYIGIFNPPKHRKDHFIHWINRIWRICSTDYVQWWTLFIRLLHSQNANNSLKLAIISFQNVCNYCI